MTGVTGLSDEYDLLTDVILAAQDTLSFMDE